MKCTPFPEAIISLGEVSYYTRIISWHIKGLIGTGFQLHMAQISVDMHNYIELTIESIFPMLSWKTKSASPSIRVLLLLIMTR